MSLPRRKPYVTASPSSSFGAKLRQGVAIGFSPDRKALLAEERRKQAEEQRKQSEAEAAADEADLARRGVRWRSERPAPRNEHAAPDLSRVRLPNPPPRLSGQVSPWIGRAFPAAQPTPPPVAVAAPQLPKPVAAPRIAPSAAASAPAPAVATARPAALQAAMPAAMPATAGPAIPQARTPALPVAPPVEAPRPRVGGFGLLTTRDAQGRQTAISSDPLAQARNDLAARSSAPGPGVASERAALGVARAHREFEEATSPDRTAATLSRMMGNWSASKPRPSERERTAQAVAQGRVDERRADAEGRVAVARTAEEGATQREGMRGTNALDLAGRQAERDAAQREHDALMDERDRAFRAGESTKEIDARVAESQARLEATREDAAATRTFTAAESAADRESAERIAGARAGQADAATDARAQDRAVSARAQSAMRGFRDATKGLDPKGGKKESNKFSSAVAGLARSVGIDPADAMVILDDMPDIDADDLAFVVGEMRRRGLNAADTLRALAGE